MSDSSPKVVMGDGRRRLIVLSLPEIVPEDSVLPTRPVVHTTLVQKVRWGREPRSHDYLFGVSENW